jgi:hypothetical protein
MRNVSLLVRLAQHELEERRSDLGMIAQARAETETELSQHDAAVANEAKIAMSDPATMAMFATWASQTARGRAQLQSRFVELDTGASAARDGLRDAAAQMKRLELVVEKIGANAKKQIVRQTETKADERELAHYTKMLSHR